MIVSPPHASGVSPCLAKIPHHLVDVGVGLVDLVDRNDHGDSRSTDVVDRFDGLRHHAVVGGDDEDRDVGRARAAGPHPSERLVAGSVDKRDPPARSGQPGRRQRPA